MLLLGVKPRHRRNAQTEQGLMGWKSKTTLIAFLKIYCQDDFSGIPIDYHPNRKKGDSRCLYDSFLFTKQCIDIK